MPATKNKPQKPAPAPVKAEKRFDFKEVTSAIRTAFPWTDGKMNIRFLWRQADVERYRVNWLADAGEVVASVFVAISSSPDGLIVENRSQKGQKP